MNGTVVFEEKDGMRKTPTLVDYKKDSLWYQLQHYKQTDKWDCGITCVSMILACVCLLFSLHNLSSLSKESSDLESLKELHISLHSSTVVWAICLAYLLK